MRDFFIGLFLEFEMPSRFFTAGANFNAASFRKSCPLKIGVFPGFSRWVEFCGTNTVGVFSSHKGRFITNCTCFCHSGILIGFTLSPHMLS